MRFGELTFEISSAQSFYLVWWWRVSEQCTLFYETACQEVWTKSAPSAFVIWCGNTASCACREIQAELYSKGFLGLWDIIPGI
jgi:hypothetical protein